MLITLESVTRTDQCRKMRAKLLAQETTGAFHWVSPITKSAR